MSDNNNKNKKPIHFRYENGINVAVFENTVPRKKDNGKSGERQTFRTILRRSYTKDGDNYEDEISLFGVVPLLQAREYLDSALDVVRTRQKELWDEARKPKKKQAKSHDQEAS